MGDSDYGYGSAYGSGTSFDTVVQNNARINQVNGNNNDYSKSIFQKQVQQKGGVSGDSYKSNGFSLLGDDNVLGGATSLLGTIGSLYQARQNYKLAKSEFAFNKADSNRNFALAKDAYERKVTRGDNITRNREQASRDYDNRARGRINPNTSGTNQPRVNNGGNANNNRNAPVRDASRPNNRPVNNNTNTRNKPRIARQA